MTTSNADAISAKAAVDSAKAAVDLAKTASQLYRLNQVVIVAEITHKLRLLRQSKVVC